MSARDRPRGDVPGDAGRRVRRQRLDELILRAAGLVRDLDAALPSRSLPAMLAVVRLLGFVEGLVLTDAEFAPETDAAILEVSRLAQALTERRRLGCRSDLDLPVGERRRAERRVIVLAVAPERRKGGERRHRERRPGERRIRGDRRPL